MSAETEQAEGQPGLGQAALIGLCPQCRSKTMFAGVAKFAPNCTACGLDYSAFNVGDGPAAFLTMVIGALDVILALWLFFTFAAPAWLIIVLLIPFTFGLVLFGLRVSKGALLITEYRRRAFEAGARDVREG